jgi:hypothetical protein
VSSRPSRHWLPGLTFVLMASGCVVPIGPEWSTPQNNYPPILGYANPAIGSILGLGADGSAPLTVEVGLQDPNTQDQLYYRWIIDYPPYLEGVSKLALGNVQPGGGTTERSRLLFAPNCTDHNIAHGFSNHRLLFAASDRAFSNDAPSQGDFDGVPAGDFLVEAAWQFVLDCP